VKIGGKQISNWWLAGGVAGAIGVFILVKRGGLGSKASSSSPTATNPLTGLPYSQDNAIDPLTSMSYLAEAQQYGSVAAAEQAISSGVGQSVGGGTGAQTSGFPTIGQVTGGAPTGNSYSSDAQWAQAVTAGLTNLGYSPTDVAAALGLYFQSQPLGSGSDGVSYLSIVQAAIAEFGPPPVGTFPLTGTRPPPAPPPKPPPGHKPPPAAKVTVPALAGDRVQNAASALASLGLRASFGSRRPNVPYYVTATSPGAGARVAPGSTVHLSMTTTEP
jgi:PASTA domain